MMLSWDTEGGERAKTNLLRAGESIAARTSEGPAAVKVDVRCNDGSISITVSPQTKSIAASQIVFPFDPRVASTTVLPARWNDDGSFDLPAIVSAPDFGQMLLRDESKQIHCGRLEGDRDQHRVDLILEVPATSRPIKLSLTPFLLSAPAGLQDASLWPMARRAWMNEFQCTSRWGDPNKPISSPPGLLANNVLSDPASPSIWFYADQMLFTPQLTPEISVASLVRRTLEYWLDHKIKPSGEMIGYWSYAGFLDGNASPIIAAWDYVEATGDLEWVKNAPGPEGPGFASRVEQLEKIADYLIARDVDHDGIVEALQSGNRGTLIQPARSCAWWDALNCGHKDAYTNAIIYRAFRCLAELESRVGRAEKSEKYRVAGDKLKANYARVLMSQQTGWLGWWRSADGELHDYHGPTINGMAIEYGLADPESGREILAKLRARMKEVGFERFDLGVPPMLTPVKPYDYLLPDAIGAPKRDDGSDTLGHYMNGGITAGQVLHFLAAHYVVGDPEPADEILRAMIGRAQRGEFQNGVVNYAMKGIDWTTWDGKPSGYEGYLADNFRFLQAVMLREKTFRDRYYRPMR